MTLGIIKEFHVKYKSGLVPIFFILLNSEIIQGDEIKLNSNNIKSNVYNYLKNNNINSKEIFIDKELKECKENYYSTVVEKFKKAKMKNYKTHYFLYHEIAEYLLVIVAHIYTDILKMRYDGLFNLYKEIVSAKQCRRIPLLQYFESNFDKEYRCELCDNCIKDLNFTEKFRKRPKDTDDRDEWLRKLEETFDLNVFEYQTLKRIRDSFKDYPTTIYRQSRRILEGSPNNLVALYFSREFSPTDVKKANTIRLLATANRILDMEIVMELYNTSEPEFKVDLLHQLNDEYGMFNNPEGIKWIHDMANNEVHRKYDEKLHVMKETLTIVFISEEFEKHSNKFEQLTEQLKELSNG